MSCENPKCTEIGTLRSSRTQYYWNGEGIDPNAPPTLCDRCWEEYQEYWSSMWDDYYSGMI